MVTTIYFHVSNWSSSLEIIIYDLLFSRCLIFKGLRRKRMTISCQKNEFPSRRTSEFVVATSQNIFKITKKLFVMFAHPMIQYDQLPAVAIKFRLF